MNWISSSWSYTCCTTMTPRRSTWYITYYITFKGKFEYGHWCRHVTCENLHYILLQYCSPWFSINFTWPRIPETSCVKYLIKMCFFCVILTPMQNQYFKENTEILPIKRNCYFEGQLRVLVTCMRNLPWTNRMMTKPTTCVHSK